MHFDASHHHRIISIRPWKTINLHKFNELCGFFVSAVRKSPISGDAEMFCGRKMKQIWIQVFSCLISAGVSMSARVYWSKVFRKASVASKKTCFSLQLGVMTQLRAFDIQSTMANGSKRRMISPMLISLAGLLSRMPPLLPRMLSR